MTIKEIFNAVSSEDIYKRYIKDYKMEENESLLEGIKYIVESFRKIKPQYVNKYSDFFVMIDYYEDEFVELNETPEMEFVVSGYHLKELLEHKNDLLLSWDELKEHPQKLTSYGIDFIPRNILATLDVCQLSIEKYGIVKIAVEILREITFYGWLEEEIKEVSDKLDKNLIEIKEHPENFKVVKFDDSLDISEEEYNYCMKICERNFYKRNKFLTEYLENFY